MIVICQRKILRTHGIDFIFIVKPNFLQKKLDLSLLKALKIIILNVIQEHVEIYLEKSFKNLRNLKIKRLKNCRILGESTIALDVNHTIAKQKHQENLKNIQKTLKVNIQALKFSYIKFNFINIIST